MKKENLTDKAKKIEEAKRINLLLWTIGSDLSGLGVIASVEWDVGDSMDSEHPDKQFLEFSVAPHTFVTFDGKSTFYLSDHHNYFLIGEKITGRGEEDAIKKLKKKLSERFGDVSRLLNQVVQDLEDLGLAKKSECAIRGNQVVIHSSNDKLPSAIEVSTYRDDEVLGVNFFLVDADGTKNPLPGNPNENQFLSQSKLLSYLASCR
jgi:hypothetical protein